MGMYQKEFDRIVEKAVLHYAKVYERDRKDIKILLSLKPLEDGSHHELCIRLLLDLKTVKEGAALDGTIRKDWELRFLEDILLRKFFDPREVLFMHHIRRILKELAQKNDIALVSIRAMIGLVVKKYLEASGRPVYGASVAIYNGLEYVKTISEEDIMSDEQLMETTQNMQNGTDNN